MPKCDVLQNILTVVKTINYIIKRNEGNTLADVYNQVKTIQDICESAIETAALKNRRATDKIPTAYIYFNGDDFIVPSPSGNPDEEYFTEYFTDALETYDAMHGFKIIRAERVVVTLREAN